VGSKILSKNDMDESDKGGEMNPQMFNQKEMCIYLTTRTKLRGNRSGLFLIRLCFCPLRVL
jgi:hypothetical protein